MSAGTTSAVHGALAGRRVSAWWSTGFTLAWLGVWMAQLTPVQLLLPEQVADVLGEAEWKTSVLQFGVVAGVAAVCTVVAYPVAGALSDRTTSRFGRRRPWIVGGALLFAASLGLLSFQHTMAGIVVGWSAATVGFCAMSAGLTALISDQVPVGQRGWISGLISAPQALGIIIGVLLVGEMTIGQGYLVLAALVVLLALPFAARVPDPPVAATGVPLTLRTLARGFWISPREHPDFGWTLLSRVLVNVGNALATSLLLYFLQYGLGRSTAEDDILLLVVIYAVTSVLAALVCGRMSDRLGRRKVFVLIASVLQVLAGLLLAGWPSFTMVTVTAGITGAGYGAFLAVDQALATQVLPDEQSRGKDLGIMNIASAIPQSLGPKIGAVLILLWGGFGAVFIASAVFGLLGALAVLPVRSVR
jgi:MFS family permease